MIVAVAILMTNGTGTAAPMRGYGEAEALAKTAVILGSEAALVALAGEDVHGAVFLTDRDELLMTPATTRCLA